MSTRKGYDEEVACLIDEECGSMTRRSNKPPNEEQTDEEIASKFINSVLSSVGSSPNSDVSFALLVLALVDFEIISKFIIAPRVLLFHTRSITFQTRSIFFRHSLSFQTSMAQELFLFPLRNIQSNRKSNRSSTDTLQNRKVISPQWTHYHSQLCDIILDNEIKRHTKGGR